MNLPFSETDFLDVFGAYNTAFVVPSVLLWAITVAAALWWMARRRLGGGAIWWLLAFHWAWSGVVYHWWFFRRINPAAIVFGALFVVQAAIFVWLAVTSRVSLTLEKSWRSPVGVALVVYGVIYPFVGLALGLRYPRMPLFAVPCPTTLVTAGFLVTSTDTPRWGSVIPILWAAIGSSAALMLGIRADLALVAAALALVVSIFAGGRQ